MKRRLGRASSSCEGMSFCAQMRGADRDSVVYLKGNGRLLVSFKHWIATIQFYAVKRSVWQLRGR